MIVLRDSRKKSNSEKYFCKEIKDGCFKKIFENSRKILLKL